MLVVSGVVLLVITATLVIVWPVLASPAALGHSCEMRAVTVMSACVPAGMVAKVAVTSWPSQLAAPPVPPLDSTPSIRRRLSMVSVTTTL